MALADTCLFTTPPITIGFDLVLLRWPTVVVVPRWATAFYDLLYRVASGEPVTVLAAKTFDHRYHRCKDVP